MSRNRARPGSEVATLLKNLSESALDGTITDAFVVVRGRDGSYDFAFYCDDFDEMMLEVGTQKIRARASRADHDLGRKQ